MWAVRESLTTVRSITIIWLSIAMAIILTGCYRMRKSNGGGQITRVEQRKYDPRDIAVMPGYKVELISRDLAFPTAAAFDDAGQLYVIESGYSYGEIWLEPKLLRLDPDGSSTTIAKGSRNGPWTGISWSNGFFYIAEGGELEGGRILRVSTEGDIKVMIANLPSYGDHHTNGPVVKDGYIYFAVGTATNAGVVGNDNAEYGWLKRKRAFHDIPCKDIVLQGRNFSTDNVLDSTSSKVLTGAFVPYGTETSSGQVIRGAVPCSGAVMRIPIDGGEPELVAWGFRNPFGLAVSSTGSLYVTENGFDVRGSRPVWGTADVLWEVRPGSWYGWPDYSAGNKIYSENEYEPPGKPAVSALLKELPGTPPLPAAQLGVHSSSNGISFSRSSRFGYEGEAFIAQFGDMAPDVGKVLAPVGFKVVRVNISNGVVRDFVTNKGKRNGPASWLGRGGLERPVSVSFNTDGSALYIVDFGVMRMTKEGPQPQSNTGSVWRIVKE